MRKLYRNAIVLTLAMCFLTFGFAADGTTARNRVSTAPTPTPKASKPNTKTVKDSKPIPLSKSAAKSENTSKSDSKSIGQIIITATNVVVRQTASAKSERLTAVKLGKIMPVVQKNQAFYQVEYDKGKTGWIAATYTRDFDAAKRETLYREIGDKYLKTKTFDYANAAEITDFLRTAAALVKNDEARADLSFKRLQFIAAALKAIPSGKSAQFPYITFIKAIENDCVYSEPSAEWSVRAESLWDLRERYKKLPVAEDIAWTAANTTIPGECEGYVNCNLYNIRAADGEYLSFYPNGKYAQKALTDIAKYLDPLVADIKNKAVYTPPSDISDRAEFNRFLTELRAIISKSSSIEKNKVLKQINDLGEGYK